MATRNFNVKCAAKYYVFSDTFKDEDGNEFTRSWDEWQQLEDDLQYIGGERGFTPIPSECGDWYDRYVIKHPVCCKDFDFKDLTFEVAIGVSYGYYGGACLDFDLSCESWGERVNLSEFSSIGEFVTYIKELVFGEDFCRFEAGEDDRDDYFFTEAECQQKVSDIVKECNEIMAANCEGVYECAGVFNSGEAIYIKSA